MATVNRSRLTRRQQEVFDFILDRIQTRGYGPTVREIGSAFGIRSPNGVMCHLQALVKKGLIQREANMSRAISIRQPGELQRAKGIPLSGTIAAGVPIETYEESETIDLQQLFGGPGQFALKVRGQSMIEDHIDDGDLVIVRRQSTARNGQIVVALVDGQETTLKRFHRTPEGRLRLDPANSTMEPIFPEHLDVLGVVIGVVRRVD